MSKNIGPGEPATRAGLFKIRHLGEGQYSIRSMLDNRMGLMFTETDVYLGNVGTTADSVPTNAKWIIHTNESGYYVRGANTGKSLTLPDVVNDGVEVGWSTYNSNYLNYNWFITKSTQPIHGIDITQKTDTLVLGNTFQFGATIYSTYSSENGQRGVGWAIANGTGSASISSTGVLTPISTGTVTVTATYTRSSAQQWSDSHTVIVEEFLIYHTRDQAREGFSDSNDITAEIPEDLEYGQKSTEILKSNGTSISNNDLYSSGTTQYTVSERVTILKNFFDLYINDDDALLDVLFEMTDHFVGGSGTDYSNTSLTTAVQNHSETQSYVTGVVDIIENYISEHNGDISGLWYDEELWIQPEVRKQHPVVAEMLSRKLWLPSYDIGDGSMGLTFAIHGVWANKIAIESFQETDGEYSGTIRFTFYDHFGLDTADFTDGQMQVGWFEGFRQWYILQHWSELATSTQPKPFVTIVTFTVEFSGTY